MGIGLIQSPSFYIQPQQIQLTPLSKAIQPYQMPYDVASRIDQAKISTTMQQPIERVSFFPTPMLKPLAIPSRNLADPISTGQLSTALNKDSRGIGSVTLDLLTLNVYGLSKPIGKDIAARSVRVGANIGGYDVVGLQETFSKDTRNIKKTADAQGLGFNEYKPKAARLTNSGLDVLSKFDVVRSDFRPFIYSSDADALAKKGVTFTRLNVPGVGFVDVYNTHYQANGDPKRSKFGQAMSKLAALFIPGFDMPREKIRLHDNQVLADFVKQNDKGYPTFIMGDFNTSEGSPVYNDLVNRLGVIDSFRQINPNDPGYTSDGLLNPLKDSNGRSRIDFLFYKPGKDYDVNILSSDLAFNHAIDGKFVSDHFGVHSRFSITPKQNTLQ